MAVTINIPSQVKTFANLAAFPASGAVKTIYIAEDTNKTYRWDGSTYVEISASAATGLTVGTTPIASGTIGRVLFQGTGNVLQQSSSLFWDGTNERLGIGTATLLSRLHIQSTITNGVGTEAIRTYGGASNYIGMHYDEGRAGVFTTNYIGVGGGSPGSFNFYTSAGTLLASIGTGGVFSHNVNGKIANGNNSGFINLWNGANGNMELVTTTNHNITFSTNNTDRGRFTNTGNLLINTTTDAGFRLDVNGTARLNASSGNDIITDSTNVTVNGYAVAGSLIRFQSRNAAAALVYKFVVPNNNDTAGYFTGNVGIGTSSPAYVLDVVGGFRIGSSTIKLGMGESGGNSVFVGSLTNQPLKFLVNTNEYARIATTGNVLINTTTDAGFRLDVNGTARITGLAYQTGYSYSIQRLQFNQGVTTTNVGYISGISNGVIRLTNASETDFTRLQFGGGTTSYPSLQRSGSALAIMDATGTSLSNLLIGTATDVASSKLTIESTTQGFLPPRGSNAQMLAIASPATGLIFFDNTNNKLNCYDGTTWQPCW